MARRRSRRSSPASARSRENSATKPARTLVPRPARADALGQQQLGGRRRGEVRGDERHAGADGEALAEMTLDAEEERVGRHPSAVEHVQRRELDAGGASGRDRVGGRGAADDVRGEFPRRLGLLLLRPLCPLSCGLAQRLVVGLLGTRLVVGGGHRGYEEEAEGDGRLMARLMSTDDQISRINFACSERLRIAAERWALIPTSRWVLVRGSAVVPSSSR